MIDRHLLRYFLAVVDTGAFSRAAALCRVSQPTVSSGIARLEGLTGQILFNRNNRRVELTAPGARLVAHARRIEAEFLEAQRSISAVEPARLIRLGIASTVAPSMVEKLVAGSLGQDGIRLEILERRPSELGALLDRGRVDLLIGPSEAKTQRNRVKLFTEPYQLVLAENHALSMLKSITCEQLADEPMLVRRQCEALSLVSQFFTAHGVRPFMAARSANEDRIAGYVRAGLGLTVMPLSLIKPGIVARTLIGLEIDRTMVLSFDAASEDRLTRSNMIANVIDAFSP